MHLCLCGLGKRRCRAVVAHLPGQGKRLLHVHDTKSGRRFLVDCGSEVSILPPSAADRAAGSRPSSLRAANGSPIRSYGQRELRIFFGPRSFLWTFDIADVFSPILGADFLCHYGFQIDLARQRIFQPSSGAIVSASYADSPAPCISSVERAPPAEIARLLAQFPQLTALTFSKPQVQHGVQLHIPTTGPPVHAKARRLDPAKLQIARRDFLDMEKLGIIRRSSSAWSSPLHMVKKEDGTWRPCGDFRRLNTVTTPDRYPVPHLQDFSANLAGKKFFSKVDLVRGFHQIPVHPDDICKTAVITPFGLFEFLRVPFGLCNAPQAFQRLMDVVCQGLDFVFVYLDDILVAGDTRAQHDRNLKLLFERLAKYGLILNLAKCRFACTELNFLGHHINAEGISPLPERVDAIVKFPRPTTTKGLQEFLGLINFYRRFICGAASILAPLVNASASKARDVTWTDDMHRSFEQARTALANVARLAYPIPGAPIALTTDASNVAVGATLEQWTRNAWQPLAFFSKKLRPPEVKYSAFDRELLAIFLACRHFRYFLEGRPFVIYTDHKPLTFALRRVSDPWSARQQHHLAAISEMSTDIRHLAGKSNGPADALSRAVCAMGNPTAGIDYTALAAEQQVDPEMPAYRTSITNLRFEDVEIYPGGPVLLCDVSGKQPRPVVPESFRRRIFEIMHGLSHPSIRRTVHLLTRHFVWHSIKKDVRQWAHACTACQSSKVQRHIRAPLADFAVPTQRLHHVNVDLVGPLPYCQGHSYLLTIVDRFTRWPEAVPIPDQSAETVAQAFAATWVARFGVPSDISSDRGAQFTSALWAGLANLYGTTLHFTTAYHPQANGLVERFHRSLKASLRAFCADASTHWVAALPWVMLGLRTTWCEDLGTSPAELLYGEPIAVPGTFLPVGGPPQPAPEMLPHLRQHVQQFMPPPMSAHSQIRPHLPNILNEAKYVFVRRDAKHGPLHRPYQGPYKVLSKDAKSWVIDYGGREERISIDRIKPAFVDDSTGVETAQPPRRGRPPTVQQDAPVPAPVLPQSAVPAVPVLPTNQSSASTPAPVPVFSRSGRPITLPAKLRQ